jgi:hypothetical protein
MYLRKRKRGCSVDPKNVAQSLMSLMQERRCAPRLGIFMPLKLRPMMIYSNGILGASCHE